MMFKRYLTNDEIAEKLTPYRIGEQFKLRKNITPMSGEGTFTEGTPVKIIEVKCDGKYIDYPPRIYEDETDKWFAESRLFLYTLETLDTHEKITNVKATSFAEGVISPQREYAKRLNDKLSLKFLILAFIIVVVSTACAFIFKHPTLSLFAFVAYIPYRLYDGLDSDARSNRYVLIRKTDAQYQK